jgi:ribosomal-protein-alanine N-acetyltransferase
MSGLLEPATPAYAAALAAIHQAAFPIGERWGPDAIGLQLGLPGAFGFVSARGGFILARVVADEAEILTLAVDPAAQRAGIGRALMGQAVSTAGLRGAAAMFLEVSEANAAARTLYAACGFSEVGRRTRYYAGGVDALVLRATISS